MTERADAVIEALGGKRAVRSRTSPKGSDLRLMVRNGLPAIALQAVMEAYQVSEDAMMRQLGISASTLRRRKLSGRLSPVESDRLYRMANAAAEAEGVLGTREKAVKWLHTANRSLQGETPLSMLDTDIGSQRVCDVLGRIEHGVYS